MLAGMPGDDLQPLGILVVALILPQQVKGGYLRHITPRAQAATALGLEQPVQPSAAVLRKLERKLALVTAVSDEPDVAGQEVAVGARTAPGFLLGAAVLAAGLRA